MFELHPQLQQDCILVTDLPLCRVLLLNDSNYPWTVLVPRIAGIKEIIDLTDEQQMQLWRESAQLSKALQQLYAPDKLNVAALGNMVPQLHVHHIARYTTDAAWPGPVWGKVPATPYASDDLNKQLERLQNALK